MHFARLASKKAYSLKSLFFGLFKLYIEPLILLAVAASISMYDQAPHAGGIGPLSLFEPIRRDASLDKRPMLLGIGLLNLFSEAESSIISAKQPSEAGSGPLS